MTSAGQAVLKRAQRILVETRELQQVKADLNEIASTLVVATTEFNARYALLPAIKQFRAERPDIAFSILSVDPPTAVQLVIAGKADFGLCTPTQEMTESLVIHKCFDVERIVITPRRHPLNREKHVTLAKLAAYPLIVYDVRLSGGRRVLDAFQERGIKVQVALSATTADAIKAYVAEGIGVGIIQAQAFNKRKDTDIHALSAPRLFGSTPVFLFFRKNSLPRSLTEELISLLTPNLKNAD